MIGSLHCQLIIVITYDLSEQLGSFGKHTGLSLEDIFILITGVKIQKIRRRFWCPRLNDPIALQGAASHQYYYLDYTHSSLGDIPAAPYMRQSES